MVKASGGGGKSSGKGAAAASTASQFAGVALTTFGVIKDSVASKKNREYMDSMRNLDLWLAQRQRDDDLKQQGIQNAQTDRGLAMAEKKTREEISQGRASVKAAGIQQYLDAIKEISRANPGVRNGIQSLFSNISPTKG